MWIQHIFAGVLPRCAFNQAFPSDQRSMYYTDAGVVNCGISWMSEDNGVILLTGKLWEPKKILLTSRGSSALRRGSMALIKAGKMAERFKGAYVGLSLIQYPWVRKGVVRILIFVMRI